MLATHDRWDPIALLEALYALEQPRSLWFRGVLEAAGRTFDLGLGVGMLLYDVSGTELRIERLDGVRVSPENLQVGAELHSRPGWADGISTCYRTAMCATLDEHVPDREMRAVLRECYRPLGVRDQILINGVNQSGFGCALYVFSPADLELSAPDRQLLMRVASHLATACRLHRRLEHAAPENAEKTVAAVLDPDGRVKHATSQTSAKPVRRVLADAVKLREWARTRGGRGDPRHATDAWKPLVLGQWSLVDCYERDGRRYITAYENAPAPVDLQVLSARELQVVSLAELGRSNKVIAYELGLVDSTVRVLLARAASKLEVRTRPDLIAKFRELRARAEADTQRELAIP